MLQMQPMPTAKKTHTGTSVNRDSTRFTILLLLPDQRPCKPLSPASGVAAVLSAPRLVLTTSSHASSENKIQIQIRTRYVFPRKSRIRDQFDQMNIRPGAGWNFNFIKICNSLAYSYRCASEDSKVWSCSKSVMLPFALKLINVWRVTRSDRGTDFGVQPLLVYHVDRILISSSWPELVLQFWVNLQNSSRSKCCCIARLLYLPSRVPWHLIRSAYGSDTESGTKSSADASVPAGGPRPAAAVFLVD